LLEGVPVKILVPWL